MNLSEIARRLGAEKSVAVICHIRPDGDAIGSACALKLALSALGIRAEAFCSDPVPQKFGFLPETRNMRGFSDLSDYSALVAVDSADVSRLGDFEKAFSSRKNTYNIDHHISNAGYAEYNFVRERASNSENVYALIKELGVKVDKNIADLLATGVATDTGGFRHKNVTPETFATAEKLAEYGADFNAVFFNAFTKQSPNRAKLFGKTMEKIRYFENGRVAIASVFLRDFEETGAKQEETEGFIDFVMGVDGVEVGACVMETEKNKFKISLRSKDADVNGVAAIFGGGGHKLASGCRISGEYEEVIDRLVFAITRYLKD